MSDYASNIADDVPDFGGGVGARMLARPPDATLGASLWELQPGASQFVYHFHHGTEELLVVLHGTPTVRMHDGDHVLAAGDVVPFPRGPEGAHQVRNDGDTPARVVIIAAHARPDVSVYPDTGKIGVFTEGRYAYHRVADAVEHAGDE